MSFNSFFQGNNPIFRCCSQITDIIMLSVMWVFCSLPIVTVGPATAALYFTVVKGTRAGEIMPYRRFLHSFKENLKEGVLASLICVPAVALLVVGVALLRRASSMDVRFVIPYAAYYFACVLPIGTVCYLFPLLGRFSFRLGDLFATALALCVRHLPTTIVVVVLVLACVQCCLIFPMAMFLLPALAALACSFFLERIFRKYLPGPPAAPDGQGDDTE